MASRKTLTCLICLLLPLSLLCQDSTAGRRHLGLSLGIQKLDIQDRIFSPFVHHDLSPVNAGLEYGWRKVHTHLVQLRFASFHPILTPAYTYYLDGEPVSTYPHSFTFVDVRYSVTRVLKESGSWKFSAGGMLDNHIQADYYSTGLSGFMGYFASFGLCAVAREEYAPNAKHAFYADLRTPLLAWVARSPYLVNDDEFIQNISSNKPVTTFFAYLGDGKLQTLNRHQQAQLSAGWEYRPGRRISLNPEYRFVLLHHSRPLPLLQYQNGVFVTLKYHLNRP